MNRYLCTFFLTFTLFTGPVFSANTVNGGTSQALKILILHSYDDSTEPYVALTESFQVEMQRQHGGPISFSEISLEERHDSGDEREQLLEALLRNLHASRPPDLIVGVGPPAVSFWLRHRDKLFPAVPLLTGAGEGRFFSTDLRPGDHAVMTPLPFPDFINHIVKLRPDTSHILVVFGATPYEHRLASFMQSRLGELDDRIEFEYTNDLTLSQLLSRVAELGNNSAIFYGLYNADTEGIVLQNGSALPRIRAASNVPIFGVLENQLGRGIIGGRLLRAKQMGQEMARAAISQLEQSTTEPGWTNVELSPPAYDWRELRAAGIDADRLPEDSTVLFKPQSLWSQYGPWMVLAAIVVICQGVLITRLLIERRRRQNSESVQSRLSGQLITAHEDERRRISRELHDDLSQRLARLAIDAGTISMRDNPIASAEDLNRIHNNLVDISKDCHDISYRLHPSLLEDLGLVTALQSEIQSVRKQTSATLVEDIAQLRGNPPPDTALCIYRIVQAALSNAVKHANARTIEISLHQQGDWITATVGDDGSGFQFEQDDYDIGLGISSMRERARLVGAQFSIHSALGQGTSVTAKTPLQGKS